MKHRLEEMRNIDLLSLYNSVNIQAENCLRVHNLDTHSHFHHAKEIQQEILKRMHAPDVVKLKIT